MFFKKLKEENKSMEKKVSKLKTELSEAQASMAEMRKLLTDKQARHTEADVAQAIRNAIVRQCEQIGEKSLLVLNDQIYPTNPDCYGILHLVEAYNKFVVEDENCGSFEFSCDDTTLGILRAEGAAHD